MGGRIYDPTLARFLSADPKTVHPWGVGLNLYAYVENNPLRYTDPTGYEIVAGTSLAVTCVIGTGVSPVLLAVGVGVVVGAAGYIAWQHWGSGDVVRDIHTVAGWLESGLAIAKGLFSAGDNSKSRDGDDGDAVARNPGRSGPDSAPPSTIAVVPGAGTAQNQADLKQASAWVSERYPELLPKTGRTIQLGDPGMGNAGATSSLTGDITIRPGMGLSTTIRTVSHELLHSYPESAFDRYMQGANEFFRGPEEHEMLRRMGLAIEGHFGAEQRYGRAFPRVGLFDLTNGGSMVIRGPDGAPAIRNSPQLIGIGRDEIETLPEWSTIRRSFSE